MSRVEDNLKVIEDLKKMRLTIDGAAIVSVLIDISQSLALIADKMEVKHECGDMEHCTICRHFDSDVD